MCGHRCHRSTCTDRHIHRERKGRRGRGGGDGKGEGEGTGREREGKRTREGGRERKGGRKGARKTETETERLKDRQNIICIKRTKEFRMRIVWVPGC